MFKLTHDKINQLKQLKSNFKKIFFGNNIAGKILRCYLLVILVVALLLYLPISLHESTYTKIQSTYSNPDQKSPYTFFDAIFMSVTAFTDTGIVNLNVAETYSDFGKWVILIAIQLGGLGFISVVILAWRSLKFRKTSDLEVSITLFNERGGDKIGNTYRTIGISIIWIVGVEIFFWIIYSFWFYYYPAYQTKYYQIPNHGAFYYDDKDHFVSSYHHLNHAIFWGIFHSISAANNAGISIIGLDSLAPYRNDASIFLQVCFILQIIFGGIGYPIIYDLFEHFRFRIRHQNHQLSLFSKVGLVSYLGVTIIGGCLLFAFEYAMKNSFVNYLSEISNIDEIKGISELGHSQSTIIHNVFGNNVALNKFFAVLFELFTTRSAGFSTFDNNLLSQPSLWTVTILMFIGANPSSTGGGIRSTAFIIMLVAFINRFRANKHVNMFRRRISQETISISYIGSFAGILLILGAAMIGFACCDSDKFELFDFVFVCVSSFGTVGLNLLNFANLSDAQGVLLIFLIILMVIGQLGVSTAIFSSTKLEKKISSFSYPTEDVKI